MEDVRLRRYIANLTIESMTKWTEWWDELGPVKADEKHNRYMARLENLWKTVRNIRTRRRQIIKMEKEVYGRVITSDRATELLVSMAKMEIAEDLHFFERSRAPRTLDMAKKKKTRAAPYTC